MVIKMAGYDAAIDIRIKTTVRLLYLLLPLPSLQELKQIDAQDLAVNASTHSRPGINTSRENTSP